MRLSEFKVNKLCEFQDEDGYTYADYEILNRDEVCFLDDVAISGKSVAKKSKRQLVEMSEFAGRLE